MRNASRTLKRYYSKPRRVSCSRMYWFENARNRDPVFRDQKVLPEVRNRPLLPRDFRPFNLPTFFLNPVGELPVLPIQRPLYL